jgi:hypothetical protein
MIVPAAPSSVSGGSPADQATQELSYNSAAPQNAEPEKRGESAESFADYLLKHNTTSVVKEPPKSLNFDVVAFLTANSVYSPPSSDSSLV